MEEIKNAPLSEEEVANAAGGRHHHHHDDHPHDLMGAHWQDTSHKMGEDFWYMGYHWYRIKSGDWLGKIAADFNVSTDWIQYYNCDTITDQTMIYAGDTIIVGF